MKPDATDQLARELTDNFVKLSRLPLLLRARILHAAWRRLVQQELQKMTPMQVEALLHLSPEAEVFFVTDIHQTAEWPGHKAN